MSRLLSDILEAPEPLFSHTIQNWERLSQRPGHDIRLVSEIAHTSREAIKVLGLDENDTTAKEVYFSLRHHAAQTNQELIAKLNIKENDSPEELVKKIMSFVDPAFLPKDVWSIKPTVVKQLLKNNPPKKYLKTLGLRSIDSVLKRSDPKEVFIQASLIEADSWSQKVNLHLKKLNATDFHSAKAKLVVLKKSNLDKFKKTGYKNKNVIIPYNENGTILLIPPPKRFDLDVLGIFSFLLHAIYDLQIYSAYLRHISVKSDFGERLYYVLRSGLPGSPKNLEIGWRTFQKHLNQSEQTIAKVEQPYLQAEHIEATDPFDTLVLIIPEAELWRGTNHSFYHDGQDATSMHLMDIIVNASNQVPYERAKNYHLKSRLWEELGKRYLTSEPIETIVIEKL